MKYRLLIILLLLGSLLTTQAAERVLKFDSPAYFFEESMVIGNGNLGAIIYGDPLKERISLNDITLWTGEPEKTDSVGDRREALAKIRTALDNENYPLADSLHCYLQGHYSENYQPLGQLIIDYGDRGDFSNYSRSLNIADAVANVEYTIDGYDYGSTCFASAPDSVIVMRVTTDNPAGITAKISLDSRLPHKVIADGRRIVSQGYAAWNSKPVYTGYKEKHRYNPARGMRFMTVVDVENEGGTVEGHTDGSIEVKNVRSMLIRLSNVTSFNGFDRDPVTKGRDYAGLVKARIDNAATMGYATLLSRHKDDYHNLFDRVDVDFGSTDSAIAVLPTDVQLKLYTDSLQVNPDLEELYFQYGRYLLISSSRTNGVPANLQGLWNESILPPWSSNYTININTEENYWPAEVTGLPELHMSLLSFLKNLSVNGQKVAHDYFGAEGWCACHNTDIWAMAHPVGEQGGHPSWANWTMGGAWLATHIWEHYLFTGDNDFLEEYYPVLKGAADFCCSWLIEKNGELITSPSTSPENMFITPDGYRGATLYGSAADLAVTRECVSAAIAAAERLGRDEEFVDSAKKTITRLHPYGIGSKGQLMEWYHDWRDTDPRHRHQSHLIGLYPGHHISVESTPELAAAAARTLEIKGDNTTGWSTGWRANLYARLKDSEGAYRIYRRLLRYISPDGYKGKDARRGGGTYPNLLDAHSPFQIDGNFGGTAAVAEMLVQSTPDSITLLPALPEAWSKHGSARGLRARGGYELAFRWRDGKVTDYEIKSFIGGKVTVIMNGDSKTLTIGRGESVKESI